LESRKRFLSRIDCGDAVYAARSSAGRTRRAISAPRSRSVTAMSYWLCRSIQNLGPLPK
jgi:hypothetical protein